MQYTIHVANDGHLKYAISICKMMEAAAQIRGTGIAKRKPAYIQKKMSQGHGVIALDGDEVVGFCYIESWEGHRYVANSGLITHPNYRKIGLAKAIKETTFKLSKQQFPEAKLFGITTSMAVMKINSNLGYKPVTFSELTQDENYWNGCKSCANYDVLLRTDKTMCICTGMICDLKDVRIENSVFYKSNFKDSFLQFIADRANRIKLKAQEFPKLFKITNNEK